MNCLSPHLFSEYFKEAESILANINEDIGVPEKFQDKQKNCPSIFSQGSKLLSTAKAMYSLWLSAEQQKMRAAISAWEIHMSLVAEILLAMQADYAVEVAENRVQFTTLQAEQSCIELYNWIRETSTIKALVLTY